MQELYPHAVLELKGPEWCYTQSTLSLNISSCFSFCFCGKIICQGCFIDWCDSCQWQSILRTVKDRKTCIQNEMSYFLSDFIRTQRIKCIIKCANIVVDGSMPFCRFPSLRPTVNHHQWLYQTPFWVIILYYVPLRCCAAQLPDSHYLTKSQQEL